MKEGKEINTLFQGFPLTSSDSFPLKLSFIEIAMTASFKRIQYFKVNIVYYFIV